MSILQASNLKKTYKSRIVVKDVSLSVESGTIVGLLGPNGAGKTTSFYMIVGLISADNGSVKINDVDMTNMQIHERSKYGLGYLTQENSIFRKLTVEENILGVTELIPGLSKEERMQRTDELLEEFCITKIRHSLGQALSGGERRRVEIARALAANPKFILLDEPFAGVDPISVSDIKNIIIQLKNKGIGILITDHNVRETLDVCEKAYIVSEGTIIAKGTASEVLANENVIESYLGNNFSL